VSTRNERGKKGTKCRRETQGRRDREGVWFTYQDSRIQRAQVLDLYKLRVLHAGPGAVSPASLVHAALKQKRTQGCRTRHAHARTHAHTRTRTHTRLSTQASSPPQAATHSTGKVGGREGERRQRGAQHTRARQKAPTCTQVSGVLFKAHTAARVSEHQVAGGHLEGGGGRKVGDDRNPARKQRRRHAAGKTRKPSQPSPPPLLRKAKQAQPRTQQHAKAASRLQGFTDWCNSGEGRGNRDVDGEGGARGGIAPAAKAQRPSHGPPPPAYPAPARRTGPGTVWCAAA
jgi:hypothetical protein